MPDLILARKGVVILAELKSMSGRLSAEQVQWAEAIGPFIHRVWRPSDLPQILEELK